jgi:hypothetical protein
VLAVEQIGLLRSKHTAQHLKQALKEFKEGVATLAKSTGRGLLG